MEFLAATEMVRFETDGSQQQVYPFIGSELAAAGPVFFQVKRCDLDRFQPVDPEWAALALLLFVILMSNIQLRPDPAHE